MQLYFLNLPLNIDVKLGKDWVFIKGECGILYKRKETNISLLQKRNKLYFFSSNKNLSNYLIANRLSFLILSVVAGHHFKIKVTGVGYRIQKIEDSTFNFLKLRLGHSHDLIYNLPKHVNFYCSSVKRSIYVIVSLYEDMIKRVAYDLRSFRAPDVYKGKGIRYKDEKLRRKEGKKNNA